MNQNVCYIKTEAGRHELHARQMGLAPKLRTLLVMIDGRQSVADYLHKLSGTGIDPEAFLQLQELGLIQGNTPHSAQPENPVAIEPLAAPAEVSAPLEDPLLILERQRVQEHMHQIRDFYNNTIRDHIGLRGFMLQLDVEQASTLEDYRALRERYVTALNKSTSATAARVLIEELDQLLAL